MNTHTSWQLRPAVVSTLAIEGKDKKKEEKEEMTMESNEVVEVAECGCCGMREECTMDYIGWVKEHFGGVWVCGLCEEAIKDEQARLGVGVEAAMLVHSKFRETTDVDPTVCIARSLLHLLKKAISSTNTTTTTPSSQP